MGAANSSSSGAHSSSSGGTSGPIASLEDSSPPFLSGFFGRERSFGRRDVGPVDAAMLKQRRDDLDSSITDEEEDDMSSTVESSIMSVASSTETNEKAYRAHQRRLRLRHAASVVAANYRGHRTRKRYGPLLHARRRLRRASIVIGAAYRAHRTRKRYGPLIRGRSRRLRGAATSIESAFRAHRARKLYSKALRGVRRLSPRSPRSREPVPSWTLGPTNVLAGPLQGRNIVAVYEQSELVRFPVAFLRPNGAVGDQDIEALTTFCDGIMESGDQFIFVHDVRGASAWSVTRAQLNMIRHWIHRWEEKTPNQLMATCIVVRGTVLSSIVNWLIKVVGPTTPTRVFADLKFVQGYLNENFASDPSGREPEITHLGGDVYGNPLAC